MAERITNLSPEDLEDFFLLLPRIFCDYRDSRRGRLKMLYIYSETKDNADSTFLRAIEMANAYRMSHLGVSEAELGYGYEGFEHSISRLHALGWGKRGWNRIPIIKINIGGNINTLSEARALVEWARSNKGDIGIVAPAFHLVRTFMTTVTAIGSEPIRVYAFPGAEVPWNEHVVHSQGKIADTRARLLQGELKRLETYRAPNFGNMATPRQVLEYLDWRDG